MLGRINSVLKVQKQILNEANDEPTIQLGEKSQKAIKKAVDDNNPRMIGKIVDILRFKHKQNYFQVAALFKEAVPGMTPAKFEQLMQYIDREETQG